MAYRPTQSVPEIREAFRMSWSRSGFPDPMEEIKKRLISLDEKITRTEKTITGAANLINLIQRKVEGLTIEG